MNPLPSYETLVKDFGPYLGLVIFLVIFVVLAQWFWTRSIIKAKNQEIDRMVKREEELNKRILTMIDNEIGVRKSSKAASVK